MGHLKLGCSQVFLYLQYPKSQIGQLLADPLQVLQPFLQGSHYLVLGLGQVPSGHPEAFTQSKQTPLECFLLNHPAGHLKFGATQVFLNLQNLGLHTGQTFLSFEQDLHMGLHGKHVVHFESLGLY